MTETVAPSPTFAAAARRVQHRLVVRNGLEWLLRTWRYAAIAVALLVLLRVLGTGFVTVGFAVSLLALWVAGSFAFALWRKADAYTALAFWDKAAARGDAFANAWWFEQQPVDKRSRGQDFHLVAQRQILPEALPQLPRDVVLPDVRWLPLLPVCALAIMLIPTGGALSLPDPKLSDEAREVAKREGQKLSEKKLDAGKMQSLTAEEKKELEKLHAKVQETAKALEQQQSKTAREVLSELERRAREAERLAEKLGAGDAAWASEQMVAEMRKHADTAELGDAVANKSAEITGKEAQELADKLKDPKLANETRDRFSETLRDIGKQAQPEDKDRTVGQHVIAADKDLAQTLPQAAAKEFQALADKMRTLAAREKAREQLEKLAQQLRESGSNVAGQGTKGMQQLAGSQGQQSSQGAQGQQGMTSMPNAPQMQPMQSPGLSNTMQGSQMQQGQGLSQNLPTLTPAPGSGQQQGKSMALAPGSGKPGQNKPGQPMLFAPIPGTDPNKPPDAVILGMSPGMNPAGSDPGNATTKLGDSPTEKSKPGQAGTVNAQSNADGRSSVRAIEGQAHNEQATRTAQATAIEAIAAEESALDDTALPPARREQVRRYFTELRRRFEKEQ